MTLATPEPPVVPLYAGFWRRAAASLIDGLLLIIPSIAISLALREQQILGFVMNAAMGCAYFAGFHASAMQATLGKRAVGINVTDLAGERISFSRAAGRF